jgi:hypothetical protein
MCAGIVAVGPTTNTVVAMGTPVKTFTCLGVTDSVKIVLWPVVLERERRSFRAWSRVASRLPDALLPVVVVVAVLATRVLTTLVAIAARRLLHLARGLSLQGLNLRAVVTGCARRWVDQKIVSGQVLPNRADATDQGLSVVERLGVVDLAIAQGRDLSHDVFVWVAQGFPKDVWNQLRRCVQGNHTALIQDRCEVLAKVGAKAAKRDAVACLFNHAAGKIGVALEDAAENKEPKSSAVVLNFRIKLLVWRDVLVVCRRSLEGLQEKDLQQEARARRGQVVEDGPIRVENSVPARDDQRKEIQLFLKRAVGKERDSLWAKFNSASENIRCRFANVLKATIEREERAGFSWLVLWYLLLFDVL